MKKTVLLLGLLAVPATLLGADHFWIIGGGASPQTSDAQIEFNVKWVIDALRELVPGARVRVFFANGDGPEPSTVEYLAEPDSAALPFEPLARVFGSYDDNRLRYRPHTVEAAEGGTRADVLLPELGRELAALEPGDQGMIIYNGHGSWAPDRSHNALRLWGETHIDVRQFEDLLDRVDPTVPVRFLFTQCFSGAFERAVHPDAAEVLELAPGTRCGFFAESEDRESEGCSASVQVGDYRDYTTYFFAALTGRTRLGEPVTNVVDWDADGRITPYDAHMYALVEARNSDLPRSTSEVYLERWQPWYFRWVGTDRIPDNVYGRAATQIARSNGLPDDPAELGALLGSRYRELMERIARVTGDRDRLDEEAAGLQAELQDRVGTRWPTLRTPYTAAEHRTVESELPEIGRFITDQEAYADLVRVQEQSEGLGAQLVELDRDLSQLEKIQRTRVLARALAQLERHGSPADVEAYGRLRACEALPLG